MIARENAEIYASQGYRTSLEVDLARTVVALYDEVDHLRVDLAAAQDRADVQSEALRLAAESAERSNAEVERLRSLLGDMHVDAAGLAEEAASLTNLLRLAEASVSLLKADLATTADERDAARIVLAEFKPLDHVEWTWPDDFEDPLGDKPECICAACGHTVSVEWGMEWAQGRDVCSDCAQMRSEALSAVTRDRDAARLEIRRLRAAEAPGTDDEAVAPWVWERGSWLHREPRKAVTRERERWRTFVDGYAVDGPLALDAMRAAVPGSV